MADKRGAGALLPLLVSVLILMAAVERWGGFRVEDATRALLRAVVEEGDERPVVLFVFHAADCPDFRVAIDQWEAMERSGEARVVGVMLGGHRQGAEAEALGLGFRLQPELARATERLMVRLGHRRTPVSLLLDRHGRVRLVVTVPGEAAAQREAAQRLRQHASWLAREG